MKAVIQRVSSASVTINETKRAKIGNGLLILLGIGNTDNEEDIQWLCRKISNQRIFLDANNLMNLSIKDVDGDAIVVSQFTLFANIKKGNRPSYINAAKPTFAIPLYEKFIIELEKEMCKTIQTGVFGAMMDIELVNNGPVTIIIDSKNRA